MKGQAKFPAIIIGAAIIIFAVLLVYSIASFFNSDSSNEKNLVQTKDSVLDDVALSSHVQQVNSNTDCGYTGGPDTDNDGIIDLCDNCPSYFNPEQEDSDHDGIGNACDFSSQGNGNKNDKDNKKIECHKNSDCGTDGLAGNLFCSNSDVVQTYISYTCKNPGTEQSSCSQNSTTQIIETCAHACENGECVAPGNITCSLESDCGTDGFIGNQFCSGKNLTRAYIDYTCQNPGTEQSSCSQISTNKTIEICEDTCENGECKTSTNITCTLNSDCGADSFINDPFCLGLSVFKTFKTWSCVNPGTEQSYCNSSEENKLMETCTEACADGECKGILCHKNSDCGTDGLTGNSFCLGNSIYRMFEEFMCILPNLPGSYCSSEVTQQSIDVCDYACLNGKCIRCDENSDCDDLNQSTKDICILPGTPFSYCLNNPIQTCQDECVLSSRVCSGNGYKLCGNYDSDSCLEWSSITSCSSDEICTNGFCVASCQDECTLGSRRCNGNGYQLCGNFDADSCSEWSLPTGCGSTKICVNGYCK